MNLDKWKGPLILLIISAIFLLTVLIMGAGNLELGDKQLFMALNPTFTGTPTFLDHFFVQFSTWGPVDWGFATWGFIIFGLILFVLSIKIEKLRPTRFILILVIAGILVGFLGTTTLIKHIIIRERPFMDILVSSSANDWVPFFYPGSTPIELFDLGLESFPSGHATAAFVFATPFILVCKNYGIKIAAVVYGILGAYARVFLGVHYPIDIFVGSFIGILTVWVFYIILKKVLVDKVPWFEYDNTEK